MPVRRFARQQTSVVVAIWSGADPLSVSRQDLSSRPRGIRRCGFSVEATPAIERQPAMLL
jgi:hypothetical protein